MFIPEAMFGAFAGAATVMGFATYNKLIDWPIALMIVGVVTIVVSLVMPI